MAKKIEEHQDEDIHYNANAERFAKSGKVKPMAKKAAQALDDPKQRKELERAEKEGKRHKA